MYEDISKRTNQRWWLMALLTILGIGVLGSSIYFLIFPNGYQGGRNPYYESIILFDRNTWDAIHLWMGLGMILVLLIHITVHWDWIFMIIKRSLRSKSGGIGTKNWRAQYNLILNMISGLSFVLASISGFYLMLNPSRSHAASASVVIFNWYTWDVIHTWSGILMFIAVFLHFYIHLGWIVKVSQKKFGLVKSNLKPALEGIKNG
jgi:hypothetical protein